MRKFITILKREYAQVVKKKSFIIAIFITPAIMIAFMVLPAMLINRESSESEHLAIVDRGSENIGRRFAEQIAPLELSDDSGPKFIIDSTFALPSSDTVAFRTLYDSLVQEVSDGGIKYFLVVNPLAYLNDDSLVLVTNSNDFITFRQFESALSDIVSTIRLESSQINLPIDSVLSLTSRVDLTTRDTKGDSIPFEVKYFTALIFVMIMYIMIITYGGTLMRSVIEEKSSRIMEVLVSSVTPFQLMLGKVMGLGSAAFTQVGIWVAIGAVIYLGAGSSSSFQLDAALSRQVFNPVLVIFFVLFFVFGYIMYSSIFALIGSIVNSDKEAQSFIFPIVLPLILPVIVASGLIRDPDVLWAQVLSYIPIFTPTMMVLKIAFVAPTESSYSLFSGILGQATLGLIIVIITCLGLVWATSRVFRVGILMYGKRPSLPEIIRWVRR